MVDSYQIIMDEQSVILYGQRLIIFMKLVTLPLFYMGTGWVAFYKSSQIKKIRWFYMVIKWVALYKYFFKLISHTVNEC